MADPMRILEGLQQQKVRLAAFRFRNEEIRRIEKQRVDFFGIREAENLHRLRRFRLNLLNVLGLDQDVLVLFIFVALHHFGPVHDAIVGRAEERLTQPRVTGAVQLMQTDPGGARRGVQFDWNRNQPEQNETFPN